MELRVHLKVCEACGCLWFRAQAETTVYCSTCHDRFKEFPAAAGRRRGRPKKTTLPAVFAVEGACQSLQVAPASQRGYLQYSGPQSEPAEAQHDALLALLAFNPAVTSAVNPTQFGHERQSAGAN